MNFGKWWPPSVMAACVTLLDRLSLLSFLCLLAGERSRFLIRLVNPSPGMMFEGTPGKRRTGDRSLEQQLKPVHTPPLDCRTELLLSGHVGTNLHVTGFIFFSPTLLHWCLHAAVETRTAVGLKELEALIWTRTLMIASQIAFVAAVAKWFNGITGRVKLKVDSLV